MKSISFKVANKMTRTNLLQDYIFWYFKAINIFYNSTIYFHYHNAIAISHHLICSFEINISFLNYCLLSSESAWDIHFIAKCINIQWLSIEIQKCVAVWSWSDIDRTGVSFHFRKSERCEKLRIPRIIHVAGSRSLLCTRRTF